MSGIVGPFDTVSPLPLELADEVGEASLVVPEGGCDDAFPTRVFATGNDFEDGRRCVLRARMQAAGCEPWWPWAQNTTGFANAARRWFLAIPRDQMAGVRFCEITPIYAHSGATRQLVLPEPGDFVPGPNRASAWTSYEITVHEDGAEIARRWERILDRDFVADEDEVTGHDDTLPMRRQSVRDPLQFFPSGSSDVVIRVTIEMGVSAQGPVNRSILGGRTTDTANGSAGLAEVSLAIWGRRVVGIDLAEIAGAIKGPLDVPPELLQSALGQGLAVLARDGAT